MMALKAIFETSFSTKRTIIAFLKLHFNDSRSAHDSVKKIRGWYSRACPARCNFKEKNVVFSKESRTPKNPVSGSKRGQGKVAVTTIGAL